MSLYQQIKKGQSTNGLIYHTEIGANIAYKAEPERTSTDD